jgi:hypothetical protein
VTFGANLWAIDSPRLVSSSLLATFGSALHLALLGVASSQLRHSTPFLVDGSILFKAFFYDDGGFFLVKMGLEYTAGK